MASIQILYEADHQKRSQVLVNSLANEAVADPADVNPKRVAGLKTLIFWGHGSHTGLCGMNSGAEVIRRINQWKGLNPDLKTVEIITCNSRHFDDSWLTKRNDKDKIVQMKPKVHLKSALAHLGGGSRINNSMGKQIKRGLKYSIYPSIRKIKVLSMPEASAGAHNQYSILYWEGITNTWCYVIGPSEKDMREIGNNIGMSKRNPPQDGLLWGKARDGDYPSRLIAAQRDFPNADYTDVKAGQVADLRGILVEIH